MFVCTKANSKLIKDLNVKSKFKRKHMNIYDLGLDKDFLCKTQKAQIW